VTDQLLSRVLVDQKLLESEVIFYSIIFIIIVVVVAAAAVAVIVVIVITVIVCYNHQCCCHMIYVTEHFTDGTSVLNFCVVFSD